jgi:cell division protein FtsB
MAGFGLKKIFNLKSLLLVNFFVFSFFAYNLLREYGRSRQLDRQIADLEATAKEVEAKNIDILNLTQYLDSGEFLEESARTKLGLKKPGEEAIVVTLPESAGKSETAVSEGELSNPRRWLNYFFGARK